MNMLAMTGGRERDLAEFDAIFDAAGLRRSNVSRAGAMTVVETVAIG
jgi:hypothetical protein